MPEMYEIIIFSLELVVPFIILTVFLSVIILGRKKRDKKSLQALISNYKEKEVGRKESINEFLKTKAGVKEEDLEETSKKIIQSRKTFLQNLISAFLTRDQELIANIDNELSIITRSYQELSISSSSEEGIFFWQKPSYFFVGCS